MRLPGPAKLIAARSTAHMQSCHQRIRVAAPAVDVHRAVGELYDVLVAVGGRAFEDLGGRVAHIRDREPYVDRGVLGQVSYGVPGESAPLTLNLSTRRRAL